METILIDSSTWINYLKDFNTPATAYLYHKGDSIIIATCPVVVQEVLQGISDDKEFNITISYFNSLLKLDDDPYHFAMEASKLYRSLRKIGITIRKPNDCLIAAYAISNNIRLLHDDRDFNYIADNSDLKLVKL